MNIITHLDLASNESNFCHLANLRVTLLLSPALNTTHLTSSRYSHPTRHSEKSLVGTLDTRGSEVGDVSARQALNSPRCLLQGPSQLYILHTQVSILAGF